VRSWRVGGPNVSYSAAQQTTDFGVAPTSLSIKITQVSALIGPGKTLAVTLPIQ
jgi:hypothetical protein